MLLKSAASPLAVLKEPVVLLKSASAPLAVLLLPVVLLKERSETVGGVGLSQWCCFGALGHRWPCFGRRLCCYRAQQNHWPCCHAFGVEIERRITVGRVVVAVVLFASE